MTKFNHNVLTNSITIQFYSNNDFEDTHSFEGYARCQANARNFMRFLLNGLRPSIRDFLFSGKNKWINFLSPELQHCLLKEKNPELLRALREEFTFIFNTIFEHLQRQTDDTNTLVYELIIQNLLALYSFTDPIDKDVISIPRHTNNAWKLLPFTIASIAMVPSSIVCETDQDQVYSYGLTPLGHTCQPILIFMGTTYDTGQGARTQKIVNTTPGREVGELLFHWGQQHIKRWLQQCSDKAIITGASLGGMLAQMFSMAMPGFFSKVYAFNPPGFKNIPNHRRQHHFSAWYTSHNKPQIYIICQESDPVSQAGFFLEDEKVTLLKICLPKISYWPIPFLNMYIQHLVIQIAQQNIKLIKLNTHEENTRIARRLTSFAFFDVLRPILHRSVTTAAPKLSENIETWGKEASDASLQMRVT